MQIDFTIDFVKTIILLFLNTVIEFLPISSTAHGILFSRFIKINTDTKLILAVSQMAIFIALVYYFWERIFDILRKFFVDSNTRIFCYNIVIATLPTIIFGLLFNGIIRRYFFSGRTIAIFLIVGGMALVYIDRFLKNRVNRLTDYDLYDIPKWTMYKIGLYQAIALLPGISRSALTIVGAICCGLAKATSIKFSFFLSLPVSFAGSVFDIFRSLSIIDNYAIILIYFIINIVFAIFFVKKLIAFLKRSNFSIFGYYRIIFGLILLFFKF